jgi:hypothetical protein
MSGEDTRQGAGEILVTREEENFDHTLLIF